MGYPMCTQTFCDHKSLVSDVLMQTVFCSRLKFAVQFLIEVFDNDIEITQFLQINQIQLNDTLQMRINSWLNT